MKYVVLLTMVASKRFKMTALLVFLYILRLIKQEIVNNQNNQIILDIKSYSILILQIAPKYIKIRNFVEIIKYKFVVWINNINKKYFKMNVMRAALQVLILSDMEIVLTIV